MLGGVTLTLRAEQAGVETCSGALMPLVTDEDVGQVLLAMPLQASRLPGLIRLLDGARAELTNARRTRHDRAGDHLSARKVLSAWSIVHVCAWSTTH